MLRGAGGNSFLLKLSGFGLLIPAGATITGIEVEVNRRASQLDSDMTVRDDALRLTVGGTPVGADKKSFDFWPTDFATKKYGAPADKWGLTPTPADLNGASFGVAIAAMQSSPEGASGFAEIRTVSVTIHYT